MKMQRPPLRQSKGFALVITLVMLALAAVVIVGLLTSASSERLTARSYDDRYQAEIAAQNGLEAAKQALMGSPNRSTGTPVTETDNFVVVRADAGPGKPAYYYLGQAKTGAITYYPLFSSSADPTKPAIQTEIINLATPANASFPWAPAVQPPVVPPDSQPGDAGAAQLVSNSKIIRRFPALYAWQPPASTQWVEVTNPSDLAVVPSHTLPYSRYAYWMEDLAGYLDAGAVGNGAGAPHTRANGTNPNEIAMFTVFDATLASDSGKTPAAALVKNRPLLFTSGTAKQLSAPATATDLASPNIATRLGPDIGGEQNLIPFGYGYLNEGSLKADLNALIPAADVNKIAGAIATALPAFKNRAGGNTFDYALNIAANIIDYTNPGNAPTTDYNAASGTATYRGIGAFPFVISAYDLNNWISWGPGGSGYQVTVEVTTYLQLWNPHNVDANGSLTVHYENVDDLQVNTNSVKYTPPPDLTTPGFSMKPNEYKVIVFPAKRYTFDWGPTPPATAGPQTSQSSIPFPKKTTANTVRVFWNNKFADHPNQNLERPVASVGMRYNPNSNATNAVWRGNAAPPIYPATGAVGDPRISFYGNRAWTVAAYDTGSTWGGRLQLGRPTVFAEVQPTTWVDGGHDSTLGTKATGAATKPDALAAQTKTVPADDDKWVSRLRASGSLESVGELGNIFDVGQWNYPVPSTNSNTGLPDIPDTAAADTSLGSGGGYTLAIGRPEFSKFDVNGQRAWQLLDVFGLGTRTLTAGLVNVNTASFEALRALAVGILHNRDNAIQPASVFTNLYPPTAAQPTSMEDASRAGGGQADLFAEAVVKSRPLLSTAQLQTITNSLGPFFGNPKQWKDATAPTEWNDAGREELFSKLLNLTTVRSRNFRVFVTGEALDRTGRVVSTVSKVYQVFLTPSRNPTTGALDSQKIQIRYEGSL